MDAYTLLAGNGVGNNALDSGGNYTAGSKMKLASAADIDMNDKLMIVPGTTTNTFKITFAGNTNKCLEQPYSTVNDTPTQVWDCTGGANQNWYFSKSSVGSVLVKNQYSGKCLDANLDNAGANGTGITVSTCEGTPGLPNVFMQHWALVTN